MISALLSKSDLRFMRPKILATINCRRQWSSHLLSNSCRSFNDGQVSSNMALPPAVGETQKSRVTVPSHFAANHSFLITYPTRTSVSPAKNHQIFINFRGEQLRHNFVSHLSNAFERHGIRFFVDKDEQRGKDLKHLFVRIEQSRIALAIFSSRYAESTWCLNELVKMKKLADKGKLEIIPVFYKVDARDVRKPTGDSEFGRNFWRLAEASSGYQIKKWKETLEFISNKMGLSLGDTCSEAEFVKEIITEVHRVIEATGVEEEENHGGKRKATCRELKLPR